VIVNPGNGRALRPGSPQKAAIVQWSDNATIFDALAQGKADLMITDPLETGVRAKLHPGVVPSSSERAIRPFGARLLDAARSDFRGLRQSMQWPNLLDLSGERQAILARWTS
jgi:cyclohexadienyl dehydratase